MNEHMPHTDHLTPSYSRVIGNDIWRDAPGCLANDLKVMHDPDLKHFICVEYCSVITLPRLNLFDCFEDI
jgi:hypothetical protein